MKYYVYISEEKIEMLFNQKYHNEFNIKPRKLALDLKIIKITTEIKEGIYQRLDYVIKNLKKNGEIGSLKEPNKYIHDTLSLVWRKSPTNPGAVCCYGKFDNTIVGLGGSLKNIIGNKDICIMSKGLSWDISFQENLWRKLSHENKTSSFSAMDDLKKSSFDAVNFALNNKEEIYTQSCEFLAVRLAYKKYALDRYNILMASPLYVAISN